ncbi:hypothetical protein H0O01_05160 [Candidatus Micrarchaeota archaeon]|nr:hypothetical protein [Candidatus Micrarchaeota archaeon]
MKGQGGLGTGLAAVPFAMLFLFMIFLIALSLHVIKLLVFGSCAFAMFAIVKKLGEKSPKNKMAVLLLLLLLSIMGFCISGYVLLVDLHPIFLNIPAKAYPPLCQLHSFPLFSLNILNMINGDYSGASRTAECFLQAGQ